MKLLKNASIRHHLTSIIVLVSFVTVLLTTSTISAIGVYRLQGNIISALDVSASLVGDRNTAALLFNDDRQATRNLTVFSVNPEIVQACIYNLQGALFARYVGKAYEKTAQCPTTHGDSLAMHDNRVALTKPITKLQDTIGFIYLESTLVQVERYVQSQIFIANMVMFAALLVSYFMAVRLQHTISRPILRLAETARAVSANKDYSIRAIQMEDVEEEDNNELVILTQSFNDMLQQIELRETRLRLSLEELEKAKDVAESASRSKSQFLANVSHELRTPLNAIIGFSSILMNQLFGALGDQKYIEYSKDINDSGVHLLDIINDILDLSKAEAGKLAIVYEDIHVGKAINKSINILSERAAKGKVAVTSEVPKVLPPLVADRLRFIQILLNIISNAVKFTEECGHVDIRAFTKETDGEVSHLVITIEDTGIGMSPEHVEHAFLSFGQVDSGLDRKYEGTGLGLPLTKKLMDLHYGTIDIKSELAKGTRVTLTFPIVPPPESGYQPND